MAAPDPIPFRLHVPDDAIAGRDNPWASTFTPTRLSLRSTPKVAELGVKYTATVVRAGYGASKWRA